jgi:crotonobetaine/carnitine-CoA ligase
VAETIPELLAEAAAAAPGATWLLHGERSWTYAQAIEAVRRAAGGLAARGAGRGDVVLATSPNSAAALFAWLGAMHLGAVWMPVDPRAAAAERDGLVAQVRPRLDLREDDLEALAGADPWEGPPPDPGAPAVLIPTSGTTGRSKLVTQTQRAYVLAGEGFPWWMRLTGEDRLMTSLPLFHINAPAYSVLGSVAARASLVLLERFSASSFLESARRYGATEFNAIGAMLELLMRRPERPDDADTPLRRCYTGPSPPRERHLEIEARFGIEIVCGYAMSESPYGLIWPHGARPFGTLGSVRQHPRLGTINEARVVDGELHLRNPAVMLGYWGLPEETAAVLPGDGWLRTGDLVERDGDTFTFVGRRKEVIRRRGENLAPGEVEEALASHPDVLEAAVVGVPSELSEEDVKAFLVLRPGAAEDLAAVRGWAAQRLAPFKLPRYVEAVDELPHTPTGRVAKHRLPRERTPAERDFGDRTTTKEQG